MKKEQQKKFMLSASSLVEAIVSLVLIAIVSSFSIITFMNVAISSKNIYDSSAKFAGDDFLIESIRTQQWIDRQESSEKYLISQHVFKHSLYKDIFCITVSVEDRKGRKRYNTQRYVKP